MKRADSLLAPVIKRLGIEESVRLELIRNDWQRLFDISLTSHMSPAKLAAGELLVNVDSPVWMQQLRYCQTDILKKLGRHGVRSLRFRVGKISGRKSSGERPLFRNTLSEKDMSFVSELLSGVSDSTLKDAVKNAVEKSLRRKKTR